MCNLQGDKIDRRVCISWHGFGVSLPEAALFLWSLAGEVFFNCLLTCFHLQLCVAVGFGVFRSIRALCLQGILWGAPQNSGMKILGSTVLSFQWGGLVYHLFTEQMCFLLRKMKTVPSAVFSDWLLAISW